MRKVYLIVFLFFSSINVHSQFVQWTFETSQPTTSGPHAAEIGTGSASGLHVGASAYSSPAGNGSLHSFSSNTWAVGDYYQFQFATTGFQDISITWDATGSATGPRDFKVQYSTDGTNFTDATGTNSTYSLTADAWTSATYKPISTRTLDLSAVTSLNNVAAVYIRLVDNSTTSINNGTVATLGTSRVDDFKVSGNTFTSNTISLTNVTPTTYNLPDCFTTGTGTVDFTSVGTFTSGNIYTAQLSDAAGAFGTPVTIGTLNSTANSGTINITIPAGTPTGATYKIRIKSNNPNVTSNLSADITINQAGSCSSSATDFFRSKATGDWNLTSTWETSATGVAGTWISATLTPTTAANTIEIRNGNTVSLTSAENADQVVIESGGTLSLVTGIFTINDDSGDDVDIQNGGVFALLFAGNPPLFGSGSPTVNVGTGGILRVSASGLTSAAPANGVNASNYVYQHQSILEYTLSGGFSTSNVTYFPNVNATTIPIFRATNPTASNLIVGGGTQTTINGILEYTSTTADMIWQNAGTKTFRNGIRGNGNVTGSILTLPSGMFIINGLTAELGGTGIITTPTSGLQIGSAGGTAVTLTSDKTVTGDISLLSTSSYVDVGTFNLTVSGNVSGGTATSYIKTPSTGSLILKTVDNVTSRVFPVGHSSYNPVTIALGSSHDWTVNVNDGVIADPPNGITGAVLRTWGITPSVNPPSAGATITFQFDGVNETGIDFNNPPYNTPDNVQAWHRKQGYWLAANTPVPLVTVSGNTRTATVTGLTQFSPYGLSRISLPLPIKLVSFNVVKLSSSLANITWELAACCSRDARFELEKSTDGINYSSISTVPGSETNRFYTYLDTRLGKGTSYYRLKATDADGKITYSRVIVIINDKQGLLISTMAPNPVNDAATVSISAAKAGMVQFTVTDLSGRIIRQWQSAIGEGSSTININTTGFANGIYHLSATMGSSKTVIRFVKQ